MSHKFQNEVSLGIPFKYSATPLASIGLDDLRSVIHELNVVSNEFGCVVFEGKYRAKVDLVIFAGNLERFSMLSAARNVASRVFYFQDTTSWWYGGSNILPDINEISSFLKYHVGNRGCLVFGQSSGGYASMAIGGLNPHYDVLACSPQTFSDRGLKQRLNISPALCVQYTPEYLLDIAEMYSAAQRSGMAAAIFSASEFSNPYGSHYWMDHLHMARIAGIPTIDAFVASSANHSIVFQRARMFSDVIVELLNAARKKNEVKREIVRRLVQGIRDDSAV